ncbi:hypothetical protein Stsp02_44330 [Streptomyces sp. NBRC 14336]|uniref:hypothetical protein n=1 Tax=Streptomyces sp. NBRC 14336 TaxID=3030992 RepID=UPI0024A52E34|nr:hypothetical protein [Streptomyces sp. NBRC 14336]WBO75800.1 hypothetical protein SBE_006537 [Streptomyces sp. SBE_14.2]GLW48771.1 hypothetical protein Stsp02_44330 [Streptomyces sp. NBRC 14336]
MTPQIPPVLAGLFDDAAVFPPGSLPIEQAVTAHVEHTRGAHGALVGAFVLAAKDIARLTELTAGLPEASFDLSVTVALPGVADAVTATRRIPAVRLVGLEVAVPGGVAAESVVPALREALGGDDLTVYVEVPRDARRAPLLAALAGTPYLAKFRTGGVRADLYPDERELAAAVLAAVRAGVPFKATAGLHHALRNTDPETGFEQHGFLNLLVATDAAIKGAEEAEVVRLLAERDGDRIAERVRALTPEVREVFRSFGTCSVAEPATESAGLGLLPAATIADLTEVSA